MPFRVSDPGRAVLDLAERAEGHLWIIAPFIKQRALDRILAAADDTIPVVVVSRWDLLEIYSGVSDLSIWPMLRDRGYPLGLVPRLHAKLFATDAEILVSSANVTGAALGWSSAPNAEVITRPHADDVLVLRSYLADLCAKATPVDDDIYQRFVDLLASLPPRLPAEDDPALDELNDEELPPIEGNALTTARTWLPQSRDPEDVLRYYQGELKMLTGAAKASADRDLAALETPWGLDVRLVTAHISAQLVQDPLVRELRTYLSVSRRFGEVSRFVGQWASLSRQDADTAWQTLMRWLVYFQPESWAYGKPRHSEILLSIEASGGW